MLANANERWGSVAKSLHWLIAALIVLEVPSGYLMSSTYGLAQHDKRVQPLNDLAGQIHHTNGFLILALMICRAAWSIARPRVAEAPARFQGQQAASKFVHLGLYGALFILPLSGWAALSVFGLAPIWFFNLKGLAPPIMPVQPLNGPFGYGLFAGIHIWTLYVGAGLLGLHIAAAVWHHWILKDNVFRRMWPLSEAR